MKILTILIASFFISYNTYSQPLSSIEIGGSLYSPSLQDKSYSSRWALSNAYSFQLRAPYYKGLIIGIEVTYFDYEKKLEAYSDIYAINYSLLFGVNTFRKKRINVLLGVETGIQEIWLLDLSPIYNPDERELYYSLIMEPQILTEKIIFFGSLKYQKVFNFRRQHILYVGSGIRIRVNLPRKIQEFIK